MRLKITRTKNDATYYAIQSTYIKGKHSSKIVMTLGKESELKKLHSDPEAWAKAYLAEITEEEKKKNVKVRIELYPNLRIEPDAQQLFNGGYLFLQQLYYDLGLDAICKNIEKRHGFDYDLNSILSRLVYGRIIHPSSKRETTKFASSLLEEAKFDQHQVYRALSVLAEESAYIQSALYKNSLKLGKRNDKQLYYDCTNYYFEIEMEQDDKQYGFSKENRPNPLIQMGLLMDGDGIPLAFTINPGNTSEQLTLRPLEKQVIRDFGNSEFVICTDAGLASTANRKFNSMGNRKFVTVQSVKTMKGFQKEWALSRDGWHIPGSKATYNLDTILQDPKLYEKLYDQVFYKEEWFNENDLEQKYIVTFSIKYMEYTRALRERQLQRAKKLVEDPSKLNAKRATDCKRFIGSVATTDNGELAENIISFINEQKIDDEKKYDGIYTVATNLEDDIQTIIKINKRRWEIEECFRIMKHDFKARPVYLHNKDRIQAHFLTCYLALVVYRLLEKRLNSAFTCEELINTLSSMQFHDSPGCGWLPMYTRTEITDALHSSFGFCTDFQVVSNLDMKKICTKTRTREKVLKN